MKYTIQITILDHGGIELYMFTEVETNRYGYNAYPKPAWTM